MPYKTGSWGIQQKERSKRRLEYFSDFKRKKRHYQKKGRNPNSIGRPFIKGQFIGSKNYNWRGGTGKLPYSFGWTKTLKESIRQRDGHKCQLCGCPQLESLKKLPIHHIDYVKSNLDPTNLITLCNRCNSRVNYGREEWERFFKTKKGG